MCNQNLTMLTRLRLLFVLAFFSLVAIPVAADNGNGHDNDVKKTSMLKPIRPEAFKSELSSSSTRVPILPKIKIKPITFEAVQFSRSFNDDQLNFELGQGSTFTDIISKPDYSFEGGLDQDSVDVQIGEALSLLEKIKDEKRLVDYLTLDLTFQLPIGVQKTIGELSYTVIFHQVKLTETNAYVDAYLTIEIPESEPLVFMGRGIEFSSDGGITGAGKVELLGNRNLSFAQEKIVLTLLGGDPENPGNTYAEFDCYGFKELSLDSRIEFSKDLFKKENPDGTVSEERLTTEFRVIISDWNDLVVDVSLPTFQLKGLKGWSFAVSNAVFDFSDVRNASGIRFPQDYESPYFIEGSKDLWRGFYLRELVVTLPKEFKKKESNKRTSFQAYDLIIDETGFTGGLAINNLIGLNEGSADKWSMSVNRLSAEFVQNEFVKAEFSGELLIPTLKTDDPIAYDGLIQTGGNYQLTARLQDSLAFDIWKADVELLPESRIELKVVDGKFKPKAILHGSMNIAPTNANGKKGASLADIEFQALTLQTEAPYINADYFGLGSEQGSQKMGNFPITINEIAFNSELNQSGLYIDLNVNLVKSGDNGFSGGSALTIWGTLTENDGIQKWKYDRLQIHEISIDVDRSPGFKFSGILTFYEQDPTYGDGFRGSVKATLGGIDVDATAIFGNVNQFRYWYVDAMVTLQNGIPVIPPFSVNGFGGGAYYHMRQQGVNEKIGSANGRSSSGIIYVPDVETYLGIKASVAFSLQGSQEALNGDVTFEVNFNSHGGVNQIAFEGNAKFMTGKFNTDAAKIKEVADKMNDDGEAIPADNSSAISGRVRLLFDNQNKVFHGNISVFVNIAGVLKGSGQNNLAGQAVLHFAPDEWYVYIGTPDNPVGIEFLGLARTESYFMVGDNLPGSPPPPDLVVEIMGNQDLDYNRELNQLESGKGIAFGSKLSVDTGDLSFLMFYGRFAATAGFDIMLKDYGDASCVGRSGPIGIDGWYANGQAYVGILATIGIKVRLGFIKKDVEIFHGAAAALMQAQGPNPFWMKGAVAGRYRVLNGLVKGSFNFEVTIGDKCEIQQEGSPLDNIDIIADLTPQEGSNEVDVFTTPQAVFNLPVNKNFELVDVEQVKHIYRAELDYFRLKDGASTIAGSLVFNDEKDVVGLETYEVFPSEKKLKLEVQLVFKEYLNGRWNTVMEKGKPVTESKSITFISGKEPDYIPRENISYSYPIESMVNFYQGESGKGYVKLDKGMNKPFENDGSWVFKASLTDKENNKYRTKFSYDRSNYQVNFNIPKSIPKGKILKFDLLRVPAAQAGAIDRNVDSLVSKSEDNDTGISTEIRTNKAEGTIETLQEKSILSFFIRSSEYNTLKEKFTSADYNRNLGWRYPIRAGIHELGYTMKNGPEDFGELEIYGNDNIKPLIVFEANFSGNSWYNNKLKPIVYQGYPLNNKLKISNRTPGDLGVPPVRAIYIRQYYTHFTLNQENGFSQSLGWGIDPFAIIYNVADVAERDFIHLRNKAANYYLNRSKPDRILKLLNSDFPVVLEENYKVRVKYVLPGDETGDTIHQFEIINPVGPPPEE